MKKSFPKSSTPQNSVLLLVLEQACAPEQVKLLKQNLLSVKRRFSLDICLLVAEPPLLFDNIALYALLKTGLINKVQISGEGRYFYHDMLTFCKRQKADLFFCCPLDIFTNKFFDWLSFFIRNNQLQLNAELSYVPPMSVFDLAVIRETPAFFANDFLSWQQAMRKSTLRAQFPHNATEVNTTFLTSTGLERLGGLSKLKQKPLLIGGQPVNA
ncbi:MAG: hypothetical protein NWQ54_08670, partial [Paraglaciecola sp.]|nr:hypothetical protein [Paraglaciecola sp.]